MHPSEKDMADILADLSSRFPETIFVVLLHTDDKETLLGAERQLVANTDNAHLVYDILHHQIENLGDFHSIKLN